MKLTDLHEAKQAPFKDQVFEIVSTDGFATPGDIHSGNLLFCDPNFALYWVPAKERPKIAVGETAEVWANSGAVKVKRLPDGTPNHDFGKPIDLKDMIDPDHPEAKAIADKIAARRKPKLPG